MPSPMISRRRAFHPTLSLTAVALALAPIVGVAQAAPAGPFSELSGSWSGGGQVALQSGARERLRCRANYRTDPPGAHVDIDIRCASDSYNFAIHSNIQSSGGRVSGTWSESTHNASGSVSGSAQPGIVQINASSAAINAQLVVQTRGSSQSVVLQAPGTDLQSVSISLHKGG